MKMKIATTMIAIKATPPTTPPAMAPAGVELLEAFWGSGVGILTTVVLVVMVETLVFDATVGVVMGVVGVVIGVVCDVGDREGVVLFEAVAVKVGEVVGVSEVFVPVWDVDVFELVEPDVVAGGLHFPTPSESRKQVQPDGQQKFCPWQMT
jgi:hypothetical protein